MSDQQIEQRKTLQRGDTVTIELTVSVDLDVDDAFPDGIPEGATASTVVDAIQESGSLAAFLNDWDITGADVSVWALSETARGELQ